MTKVIKLVTMIMIILFLWLDDDDDDNDDDDDDEETRDQQGLASALSGPSATFQPEH